MLCCLGNDRAIPALQHEHAELIVGVKQYRERKKVYDLTVDNAHCFFANGILVHNCQDCVQALATCYDRPKQADDMMKRLGNNGADSEVTFASDYPMI